MFSDSTATPNLPATAQLAGKKLDRFGDSTGTLTLG
jgi:hypothetical protein